MELIPSVLEVKQIAPLVCVAVMNASCTELSLESRITPSKWLTMRSDPELRVKAGETVRLWYEARTLEMQTPETSEIVVTTQAGEARSELLVVSERPKLTISPTQIVFWSNEGESRSNGTNRTAVSIAPEQGKLKIVMVRPELARQLTVTGFVGGSFTSRQEPVWVEVGVDEERLLSQNWPPTLVVEYVGPHGDESVVVPMPVIVKQAPRLTWDGADAEPALRYYSERQRVDVVLSNRDPLHRDGGANNAELVIDLVTLTGPAGLTVTVKRVSELPLRLAGGAAKAVTFVLDFTGNTKLEREEDRRERLIHFALEVRSNAGFLRGKMPLRLEPLRVFDGFVAIDFGSSNTCCAVVQPGERPTFLSIDEERVVAPTIVRYLDMSKTPAEITVGATVKELAAQSDEVAASTVGRLKQRLGEVRENIDVRPKNSDEWVMLRASVAAADYLREIRRRAEAQENAIFRDFILTHPARCPLRQYRRMQEALREAFGQEGKRIEYLQEPVAALLPFFAEMAERGTALEYTAASFDLGGGTTDVAVIRVRQTCLGNGEVEVEPEILFCRGVNFGGEDFTDYLERALRKRCVARLKQEEPGSELISDDSEAPAKADVLMNSAALRTAAEGLKASLSEEGMAREPELVTLRIHHSDGRTDMYPFRFAGLCVEGGSDLRMEFGEYVRERVSKLAELLQLAAEKGIAIDTIRISGKTSYLPAVGQVLQQVFPHALVRRAAEPKECVVEGACLTRTMRSGKIRLKLPRATHRMTSSIGVWPSRTSPFVPALAADMEIPEAGREESIPFTSEGLETVSLWENTGGDDEDPVSLYDRGLLTRLGNWQPKAKDASKEEIGMLRVSLKAMQLEVALVSVNGVAIVCIPTQGEAK